MITGVAKIHRVRDSLIVASSGTGIVRPLGRRAFLKAGGLLAAGAIVGCKNIADEDIAYIVEGLAVAAADILGVYLIGVPVGDMVAGAVRTISAADSGNANPSAVDVQYESSQGSGQIYDFSGMPKNSDTQGHVSMDTQGKGWVQRLNTIDEAIEYVELIADDGTSVKPTYQGQSGFLASKWLPGEDIHLTGVLEKVYSQMFYQTKSGKKGYLSLSQ